MITCYSFPELWDMKDVIVIFILGYFLHFYTASSAKNKNFIKMKKPPGYIIILHNCTKNHDHMP